MKSTKFWVCLLAVVLLASVAGAIAVLFHTGNGVIANVYQNGQAIHSIDLSKVEEGYTIKVSGRVENIISVEKGRICVGAATCPDQVCVHQGWISNSVVPVVCLPNKLVIQIENAPDGEIDAIAG